MMQSYVRPPITEAIIEFRFDTPIDQVKLKKIADKLKKSHYPDLQQRNNVNLNIEPNQTGIRVDAHSQTVDYRLASNDQADIVMISPTNLVVVRLAPYPGWDEYYERVALIWKIWKSVVKAKTISRVGVRYINRIDVPLDESGKIEIEDYLNFYPKDCVFPEVPMGDYLIQITKPTPNPLWHATIVSTPHPPPLIKTLSLLFDIDIFRTQEIPLEDDKLLSILIDARDLKNKIFAQCITRKSEALFR